MAWKERLDKLLSREFLAGLLPFVVGAIALFLLREEGKPFVEFDQWAFWSAIFLGIPAASLTVQKTAGTLKSGS